MKNFYGIKLFLITCLVMLMGSSVKAEEITEELTASYFPATSNQYKDFSGVTITDGTGNVYAGNSATSYDAIQLRNKNSNSGIVTTAVGTSVRRLKSITIEWNTETSADRTIDVYGKNEAYTSAAQLYSSATQGENIASVTYSTATEQIISGDYKYIGIRSKSGALYIDKITLVWETGSAITLDEDADNSSVIEANKVADITLTRTLSNSYWNTFCVPFDITAEQVAATFGDGTKITEYLGQNGTTMLFEDATSITAGTPYLIKPAATTENPTFNGVTISATEPQTVTDGDYSFIGTYSPTELVTDGTALFVATDGTVKKPSAAGNTIKGMRAYIKANSEGAAKALSLSLGGGTTGISTIESAEDVFKADGKVYNMNGQQMGSSLDELPHGMYIVNGKKVIK